MHDAPFLRAAMHSARRQLSNLANGLDGANPRDAEILADLAACSDELKRVETALAEFQSKMRDLAVKYPRVQLGKLS